MVMSRSIAVGSIVTGCIILGFTVVTGICAAISASKLSGPVAAVACLCSLYYAAPGILTIVAGATKRSTVMSFALFFNIIAVIVSMGASFTLIYVIIGVLGEFIEYRSHCENIGNTCACIYYSGGTIHVPDEKWKMSCDDLDIIYSIVIVCLVVFIILAITTLTASIFGCRGTCCAPVDPIVLITAGAPMQTAGGTVFVASNQSSSAQNCCSGSIPLSYGYAQPQEYRDKSGLVNNMAI